jgi:CRP-like cAMP-binding protein
MMLFYTLEVNDFDLLLEPIDNLLYPTHHTVYLEGEKGDAFYTIRSGLIKLEKTSLSGNRRIVRLLSRGSCFSLETLLDKTYQHTAAVLQDLNVCRIPVVTLKRLNRERPALHLNLTKLTL